jgi:hypothetical protein
MTASQKIPYPSPTSVESRGPPTERKDKAAKSNSRHSAGPSHLGSADKRQSKYAKQHQHLTGRRMEGEAKSRRDRQSCTGSRASRLPPSTSSSAQATVSTRRVPPPHEADTFFSDLRTSLNNELEAVRRKYRIARRSYRTLPTPDILDSFPEGPAAEIHCTDPLSQFMPRPRRIILDFKPKCKESLDQRFTRLGLTDPQDPPKAT